jgi:hypothetical protein
MSVSRETVLSIAAETGFRSDMVEKVLRLLDLLAEIGRHPYLG